MQPPQELAQEWQLVTSALAADALDVLGHRAQCLAPDVRPLALAHRTLGRAFTVRAVPAVDTTPDRPYEGLLSALDDVPAGAVFVLHTGRLDTCGIWGELITTGCLVEGVAGALTDGLIRDVPRVLDSGFPVFSRGAIPYDSKGRVDVVHHGEPVVMDGVTISPGDVIVGDADGVCVVPTELEARVLPLVLDKLKAETRFRSALERGMSVSDAFRAFRTL